MTDVAAARAVVSRAEQYAERIAASGDHAWKFIINTAALKRLLAAAHVAGYSAACQDASAAIAKVRQGVAP